jgi:molecular chaperone GrpE
MTDIRPTLAEQPEGAPEPTPANEPLKSPGASAPGGRARPAPTPANGDADGGAPRREDGAAPTGVSCVEGDGDARGVQEIEGDLDELVKTAKQRDDYLALAQRTQADFENYRKRVAREAAAARERGVSALAKELLPALDNLDRALEAAAEDDPLLQGVRLVRTELKAALARAGIESFCPLDEPFDPSVHEAVATAEQPPGGRPSGTVVEVYQDGYRLGDGVLRPARVVVAA